MLQSVSIVIGNLTLLCCCLILFGTPDGEHCGLHFVTFAAAIIAILSFLTWAIISIYVIARRKLLTPLPPRAFKTLSRVETTLFIYWIASRLFPALTDPWIIPPVCFIWLLSVIFTLRTRLYGEIQM